MPTLVAAAGEPNVKEKLLTGYQAAGKTFKVHLDGYDQRDVLAGTGPGKRQEFFYWTDDGNLAGLRYDRWKIVFLEQRAEGLAVWENPLIPLRFPKLFDIKADPFERAAGELSAMAGESIDLGRFHGVVYYTSEGDGYRVVATVADGEAGLPVRFLATLAENQSATISVPGKLGEPGHSLEISRSGDRLTVTEVGSNGASPEMQAMAE